MERSQAVATSGSLAARAVAELLGTFLLVFLGCGAVHAAVLTEAQSGVWQVAIVWGVGVALAGYTCGGISGAHINPAITVTLAACGRSRWGDVPAYVLAQLAGAVLAAAGLWGIFQGPLQKKEQEKGVVRGQPGSVVTAMCYGEYFPNPAPLAASEAVPRGSALEEALKEREGLLSTWGAFAAEAIATGILALVVLGITDGRNRGSPGGHLSPLVAGLTVASLISVIGPLTQACLNPARDLGPRLFAYLAGWGSVALPGPRGHAWFTVYIAAPCVGALIGGLSYGVLLGRGHASLEVSGTRAGRAADTP
jgi:glycerol uptake facilitator protein